MMGESTRGSALVTFNPCHHAALIEPIQHILEVIMSALTVVLLNACLPLAAPVPHAEQLASLPEVAKRLRAGGPGDTLIEAGVKRIAAVPAAQLTDELAFLSAVADRRLPELRLRRELGDVAEILERKYRDDPDALLRVLLLKADLYRDCLSDRKKEREILEKAEALQADLQARQAVSQLTVYFKLGESSLGAVDPKSGTTNKAREYYAKVIAFEFPARPTNPYYGEYQAAYTKAACRLVEMSTDTELKNLRFHPFAFEMLAKHYPDKVKLISNENPWVAEFNARVERWLELEAKNLPQDSPMRVHFALVLEHLRKNKP
ncbi:hypothetical protein VT84_26600 [Gemmata sp. SH-PL17]|nr:hypothetical protein VT84_26600 [Gemmata sp. SH-PL17]